MMALLHANPHDAVVFGDGLNDLAMFRKPFFHSYGECSPNPQKAS